LSNKNFPLVVAGNASATSDSSNQEGGTDSFPALLTPSAAKCPKNYIDPLNFFGKLFLLLRLLFRRTPLATPTTAIKNHFLGQKTNLI
jgi:hypothetical protein